METKFLNEQGQPAMQEMKNVSGTDIAKSREGFRLLRVATNGAQMGAKMLFSVGPRLELDAIAVDKVLKAADDLKKALENLNKKTEESYRTGA